MKLVTVRHRRPGILRSIATVLLALVLVSCGGSGSKSEKTPTPAANQAQPTATVALPPASSPAAQGTPVAPGAIAIPTTISTPVVGPSASPAPSTTGASASTPVPPAASGTPATSTGGLPVGDGTGAVAAGSPAATPASGTPVPAAETVTSCTPESVPRFRGTTTSYVVREELNFRAGPGTDCESLGEPLTVGTALTVTGGPVVREGEPGIEWVEVEVDGQAGWVAAQYIEPAG